MVFGIFVGAGVATIWVVVSPWIPGSGIRRALLAMPIAVGLGAFALIDGDNRDFVVLDHDPGVVGVLLALIAVIGFLFAVVDDALDRRLPRATGAALAAYGALTFLGVGVAMLVILSFVSAAELVTMLMGLALIAVGLATLGMWLHRVRARAAPTWLIVGGRIALVAAVALGSARTIPELIRVLGMA